MRRRLVKGFGLRLLLALGLFGAAFRGWTYRSLHRERLARPLIDAVRGGSVAQVRALLADGAPPDARDKPVKPIGFLELFKRLWRREAHATDENFDTALMIAATTNDSEK